MANDPHPSAPARRRPAQADEPFPYAIWALWTLAVVATAVWVAWPALLGEAPLDTLRLVVRSALVGGVGLLLITVIEIRVAPWRLLD